MKYSFFVKFLAVLLCAASLLGIVAFGGSILILTEGGLYNRPVEEMLDENIRLDGAQLAQQIALRYASTELGGVSAEVARQCFPSYPYRAFSGNYGYALIDADGNTVDSLNLENAAAARTYSFPVTGQYASLVSAQSEAERYPAVGQPGTAQTVMTDGLYIYDGVSPQGASITRMMVTYRSGTTDHFGTGDPLGTAYRTAEGQVLCMITNPSVVVPENTTVTHVILASGEELVYEASFPEGVGYITRIGNTPMFASTVAAENQPPQTQPEETIPEETIPETVPETVPETLPPETLPPETVPETEPFIPPAVTDNVPQEGNVEAIVLSAKLRDGTEIHHKDEHGLGSVTRDAGAAFFVAYDAWEEQGGTVLEITILDGAEEVIYQASHADGVGELYMSKDHLCFREALPQPPVVETLPPETLPPETLPPETEPETLPAETVPETEPETLPQQTLPTHINGKPLSEYDILTATYTDSATGQKMYVDYVYVPMPQFTLELYLTDDAIPNLRLYELLETVRAFRDWLLPALGVSILVFLLTGIYLVLAAGKSPGSEERQAGGMNRIPLDLYLVLVGLGIPSLGVIVFAGIGKALEQNFAVGAALGIGASSVACLLTVGFFFAAVAQAKTPEGFWWKNLLIARLLRGFFRLIGWIDRQNREYVLPIFARMGRALWNFCSRIMVKCYRAAEKFCLWLGEALVGFFRRIRNSLHRFLKMLPLTWQWLVGGAMLLMMAAMTVLPSNPLLKALCLGIGIFLIIYGANCFGKLLETVRKMRKGDLNTRVEDKSMVGAFRDFAGELNDLAGVAVVASSKAKPRAEEDLTGKLRAPLAEVLRCADLLDGELTEEERAENLALLREEARKLENLLDGKENEPAQAVEILRLDPEAAVAQVLEEYMPKLENAHLTPVVKYQEGCGTMLADEWMLWRTLSILLENVAVHALAGTRVYLNVTQTEDHVRISLRNISREIPEPQEAKEGSGLAIATSLMHLQNGEIQTETDADLFKVTLVFPKE